MPWKKLLALFSCMLLLTGCSKNRDPVQGALDFRTALMEAGGCSFTAEVTAHYEDRLYTFTMTCVSDEEGTRLAVTEPEILSGITAAVASDGTKLEFDGAILDFGSMSGGRVSPVEAPWILATSWTGAYISCAGPDGEQERVTYLRGYDEEELTVDTWLLDGVPTYGEVSCDGVRWLAVSISDFQMIG